MSVPLNSDAARDAEQDRGFQIAGVPGWVAIFLLATAAVSLITSHYRLMAGDDLLEVWCDRVGSFRQLLHIQGTAPLVIDPFFYHGLTFAVIRLFGVNRIFLRLPSLLGFLAMQVCLFYFVRRIASARAAVFALAFPMVTAAFAYTLQVRPYGLLLGLFGLGMLSWQRAARRENHRAGSLMVLALCIAVAINSQYYGVLLMLPLCAAEMVRALQRRRFDMPMLLSLGAGLSGMVFLVPFMKGAAEFRGHYKAGNVPYQSITQTYNFIVLGQSTFSVRTNHLLAALLVLLVASVLWGCIRQRRGKAISLTDAEFAFLLTLAALPIFAFLLGHFITHAMESRYALGAVIGIGALVSIALIPVLNNRIANILVLLLIFSWFALQGAKGIWMERQNRDLALASLVVPPKVEAAIMSSPTQLLYTQDVDLLGFLAFHDANSNILRHMALVYSVDEEMHWNQSETDSRIVENLKSFAPYTILPYESVMKEPVDHVFIVTHGGWNWMDKAFENGNMKVTPIGEAFGGEVVSVKVPTANQGQRVP